MKKINSSIFLALTLLIFNQCGSTPQLIEISSGEQLFQYTMYKLQPFKGLLWLYRINYKSNPNSFDDLLNFIIKYRINFDNPFSKIDFISSGNEEANFQIQFALESNNSTDIMLADSSRLEVKGNILMRFWEWESSIVYVNGNNLTGSVNHKGIETKYSVDTTGYYLTMISEETIKELKNIK